MEISVVIPLYNKEAYIARAINSVLKQKTPVKEIIVVDDGSTDKSVELVLSVDAGGVDLRLVTQNNSGVSVARNRGVQESTCDFVCFLDADDEWLPNFTEEMSDLVKKCPAAAVYSLRHEWVSSDGRHVRQRVKLPAGYSGIVENFIATYRKGFGVIHSSCIGIRKDTFFKHGGFPPGAKKSQDIFLWLVLGMNEKIAFRDVVATLRHEAGSGVSLRKNDISYHLLYFMDERNYPNYRTHGELSKFLRKSILAMVLENKLHGNNATTSSLVAFGKKFNFLYYGFLLLFANSPGYIIRWMRSLQQALKRYK